MTQTENNSFDQIPLTIYGHFILNLHASIYYLIHYIHFLTEVGGPNLEQVFNRFTFLAKYFHEIRRQMPDGIDWNGGKVWWDKQLSDWEANCSINLPLQRLTNDLGLGFHHRLAFMIAGLVEEDSRFGSLFLELQEPLGHRRPTLEMVGHIMKKVAGDPGSQDPWSISQPLITNGLITVTNRDMPRSEWLLRIPPLLWDAVRGNLDNHAASWYSQHKSEKFPEIEDLIYSDEFRKKLSNVPKLIEEGKIHLVVLRSDEGADTIEVLGSMAKRLGRSLIYVHGKLEKDEQFYGLLGPLCTMTHSLPLLSYDLGPGESIAIPHLDGYTSAICLTLGNEGGISGKSTGKALTLNLPIPGTDLRKQHWLRSLKGYDVEDIDNIVERVQLSGGYIHHMADIAIAQAELVGRSSIRLEDVKEANRSLNRQRLDTLADLLDTQGCWDDLVVGEYTSNKLHELQLRCEHRETLVEHKNTAHGIDTNRGVRALFSGASGTGKTLAAKILAAELGMDLYRVDLAAVINKYIGETEKNLHRVLSRAESLDVILLLDEGDALLGTRTNIRSANDRYANMETNYLLQRLENYQGIVLVTTNLGDAIDPAFQRRMDIAVPFFPPQAEERLRIFLLHLPQDHAVDHDYLQQVAIRCALTGSQIRSASLHATLLAINNNSPVERQHLEEALVSEFRKAGSTFPLRNNNADHNNNFAIEDFITALRENTL